MRDGEPRHRQVQENAVNSATDAFQLGAKTVDAHVAVLRHDRILQAVPLEVRLRLALPVLVELEGVQLPTWPQGAGEAAGHGARARAGLTNDAAGLHVQERQHQRDVGVVDDLRPVRQALRDKLGRRPQQREPRSAFSRPHLGAVGLPDHVVVVEAAEAVVRYRTGGQHHAGDLGVAAPEHHKLAVGCDAGAVVDGHLDGVRGGARHCYIPIGHALRQAPVGRPTRFRQRWR
mmetsp:Transcript_67115/g.187794  ORF Transcript_67115/g.187794 Transcript_67115/m.187794 type:complete len:232 (+) Transcript_67115:197-892(+)